MDYKKFYYEDILPYLTIKLAYSDVQWRGISPLRPDAKNKTSFLVHTDTLKYKDFGSGESGDALDYIRINNGLETI